MTEHYKDTDYAPPGNGAVVLAISDLCAGGPRSAIREAESDEWLEIAKRIRDAGSFLVVLNPYPPDRWPQVISEQLAILYWDAATRAGNVRRTRRRVRK